MKLNAERRDQAMAEVARLVNDFTASALTLNLKDQLLSYQFEDLVSELIDNVTHQAALAVCQPERVRFSVDEIVAGPEGIELLIRSGKPAHRNFHGFGKIEFLYEPRKEALIRAFETGKVVPVFDARHHSDTQYMHEWASQMGIKMIIVVPLAVETKFAHLAIIDILEPDDPVDDSDVHFLQRIADLVSRSIVRAFSSLEQIYEKNVRKDRKMLEGLTHIFRNDLMAIGGFARQIVSKSAASDYQNVARDAGIIWQRLSKLGGAVDALGTFAKSISAKHEPVLKSFGYYLDQAFDRIRDKITMELESGVEEIETTLSDQIVTAILALVGQMALRNSSGGFILRAGYDPEEKMLKLSFEADKLGAIVPTEEAEMLYATEYAARIGATLEVARGDGTAGCCVLQLPQSEYLQ